MARGSLCMLPRFDARDRHTGSDSSQFFEESARFIHAAEMCIGRYQHPVCRGEIRVARQRARVAQTSASS